MKTQNNRGNSFFTLRLCLIFLKRFIITLYIDKFGKLFSVCSQVVPYKFRKDFIQISKKIKLTSGSMQLSSENFFINMDHDDESYMSHNLWFIGLS